ncbi:MAG: hypothetical protein ABIH23_06640, partial [bacterium]
SLASLRNYVAESSMLPEEQEEAAQHLLEFHETEDPLTAALQTLDVLQQNLKFLRDVRDHLNQRDVPFHSICALNRDCRRLLALLRPVQGAEHQILNSVLDTIATLENVPDCTVMGCGVHGKGYLHTLGVDGILTYETEDPREADRPKRTFRVRGGKPQPLGVELVDK